MSDVRSLSPKEAFEFLKAHPNALFVDVRSNMEYLFVGHAAGSIHIPWIDEPDWKVNPNFVTQIRQAMLGGQSGAAPVVLICRSGVRSLEAGQALAKAGITDVYNVAEGFEGALDPHHHRSALGGWRFHGLPWEQC
jgi:rhodanese-related sulfurtransferase